MELVGLVAVSLALTSAVRLVFGVAAAALVALMAAALLLVASVSGLGQD